MTFLKTILIFLLVFFALRIIWRLSKPYIFRYVTKKAGEKFQKMAGQFNNQAKPKQPEGTTTILNKPHGEQHTKKNVGEYIDYEEID
jgi:ABC-type nickel/cobalt efflux system permease component RcnA